VRVRVDDLLPTAATITLSNNVAEYAGLHAGLRVFSRAVLTNVGQNLPTPNRTWLQVRAGQFRPVRDKTSTGLHAGLLVFALRIRAKLLRPGHPDLSRGAHCCLQLGYSQERLTEPGDLNRDRPRLPNASPLICESEGRKGRTMRCARNADKMNVRCRLLDARRLLCR